MEEEFKNNEGKYPCAFVPFPSFLTGEKTVGRKRIKENGKTRTVEVEDKLNLNDVMVMGVIMYFARASERECKPKGCFAGNDKISYLCCGIHRQTIENSLFKLEKAGYITVENPRSKKRQIHLTSKIDGRKFKFNEKPKKVKPKKVEDKPDFDIKEKTIREYLRAKGLNENNWQRYYVDSGVVKEKSPRKDIA